MRRNLPVLAWVVCVAMVAACAVGPEGSEAAADPDLPGGKADDGTEGEDSEEFEAMSLDIHWVRNSAEYRASVAQSYTLATRRIDELAAEREAGTWAVVLDVDETVLSNSTYQKERAELGKGYSWQSWRAWVQRHEAYALPGVTAFLGHVHELGGRVALVTNRRDRDCPDTEENLALQGVPYDVILCRTDDSDKQERWDMVEAGTASEEVPPLEIVMWVGDNIHDFPEMDQEVRHEADEALAGFGDGFVLIPNPMYGSWVGNPRY
jgi:5'-nucleotidase (lipoprotein e(P4) family)